MSTLERAIVIAAEAHAGQTDKAGAPYLLHTLRVMMAMTTIEERIVAALHDVVEDCYEWTLDRIRSEGFSETIVEALDSVTKRADEVDRNGYFAFVRRAGLNTINDKIIALDPTSLRLKSQRPQKLNATFAARKFEFCFGRNVVRDTTGGPEDGFAGNFVLIDDDQAS